MKPCPSCSRSLADNAQTCPQCGHFLASAGNDLARIGMFAVYLIVAAGIIGVGFVILIWLTRK